MTTIKNILLLSLLLFLTENVFSAHIVGGGITYECMGPNANGIRYRFTMKIYRDCGSGGATFDNPANIAIYNGSYQVNSLFTNFSVAIDLTQFLNVNEPDCIDNLPDICLQEATYIWERTLPVSNQSYFIVYQRCCRTNAIANILNPGDTGATYYTEITPEAQQLCNNSPVFNNFPPILICNNYPLEVDYSATDPDGDQLVYSFCAPFAGGGNLQGNGSNSCDGIIPSPPCSPPFDEVAFIMPTYSASQPMAGNPVISIDPQTGVISGTPQMNGQFVVGVCVEEYRNGQLLSVTRRDFQFNVTDCAPQATALVDYDELLGPKKYAIRECSGTTTITIENQSIPVANVENFEWFFDLNNGSFIQDSTNFDLTATFPGLGVYNGILVLNEGLDCGDTAFITVELYAPAALDLGPDFTICQDTNLVLNAGPAFESFLWHNGSTTQTFQATSIGVYHVSATDHCGNVFRDSVFITGGTAPPITLSDASICPGDAVTLSVPGYAQVDWSPGAGLSCTSCATVSIQPTATTTYTVTATTQAGCTATETVLVEVLPTPMQTYVIQFYPNESVTIGGQTYTQPATVTIPVNATTGGCDSLNTYILELLPTTLSLLCPPDLTVALPNNATTVPVNYLLPTSITDCPGVAPLVTLSQGLPPGGNFSSGLNTVCYNASNTCGDQASCCFTVMVSTLSIQCPPNRSVQLPVAATTVPVNYVLPTTTTNCPDPSVTLSLVQGLASGSGFPLGLSTVCFQAQNTCGNQVSCCFNITVQDAPPPCDIKVIGCMKFELLDIRLDSIKQPRFRIRATNYCASELTYILSELPPGVVAVTPQEASIYTAPNTANTYIVRNPNFSPFYSVRYRSITPGLKNGEADIFEHRLPQQSFPNNYIHMYAKLKNGESFEAYLNTFYCPVQPWAGSKPLDELEIRALDPGQTAPTLGSTAVSLHPNPTAGVVMVDMLAWQGQRVQLRVVNSLGQEVVYQGLTSTEEWLELNLDPGLANGLYYLVLQPEGGATATARFVLER